MRIILDPSYKKALPMTKKISYRIENWKDYNRSLINRGNITLWFSEDAIKSWYHMPAKDKSRGRSLIYSDSFIELVLTLRRLFDFSLRATQGFMEGMVHLLGLKLQVAHYSRLSRRAAALSIDLLNNKKMITDLVIDSTGLKVYGEGEWKVRTHGTHKRRSWRKYHVAVDPDSHEVTAVELTQAHVHDGHVVEKLLSDQIHIGKVYGDGAYSYKQSFDPIADRGGTPLIAIRRGTSLVKKMPSNGEVLRNQLVREIWAVGGQNKWKKTSGYHRRSLVETHMFRLKTILGGVLRSRKFNNQITEAKIMAKILNKMTSLGMPKSVKAF